MSPHTHREASTQTQHVHSCSRVGIKDNRVYKKKQQKRDIEGLLEQFSLKKSSSISHINTEINKWHIEFLI